MNPAEKKHKTLLKNYIGLDQYLYKRHYVGNKNREKEKQITTTDEEIDNSRIAYITEEIFYWRKANAIHRWFEKHCGDDIQNCADCVIHIEDLKKLLTLIKTVLERNDKAEELLPTTEGFFFGSTDYDEYYFDTLRETAEMLEKIAKEDVKWEDTYVYNANW